MNMTNIDEIIENMEFLDNWEDKYKYIIELGQAINDFPEDLRNNKTKVNGCVSQVWLFSSTSKNSRNEKLIKFIGDSDAFIVKGLIAILISIYTNKKPEEILEINPEDIFKKFGLETHLSPQRSNGLLSMIERIKNDARENVYIGTNEL
jgi:cysteine desulfuration protein SufE|tara:strand:- start:444 stop:890 length:447 start_codon:yes stop_codon:yes gene_type:complete